jgi:hypothetical protein
MTKKVCCPAVSAKSAAGKDEALCYRHSGRGKSNPEVGIVTLAPEADNTKNTSQHYPRPDPLHVSLSWTGNREHLSFEVNTAIRAELDEDRITQLQGEVSLPFATDDRHKVALNNANQED